MRKRLIDVAKEAGVSVSLASRALRNCTYVNDEKRKKVFEAAKKIGYRVNQAARSLKTNKSGIIGLVVSDITNPWFTTVARAIEDVAEQNDYSVILCNSDEDIEKESKYLKLLLEKSIDGLIISFSSEKIGYREILRFDLPIVQIDRKVKNIQAPSISIDNEEGAYQATKHLINLGYKKIGFINGSLKTSVGKDRFEGYRRAILESGMQLDEELIENGDFRKEKAKNITKKYLKLKDPPSAIFVANNSMVLGALEALREENIKIPSQIALVGFDDPDWAVFLNPSLTAIRQPEYSIGVTACQMLLQKIKQQGKKTISNEDVVVKPELIIRESCGWLLKHSK